MHLPFTDWLLQNGRGDVGSDSVSKFPLGFITTSFTTGGHRLTSSTSGTRGTRDFVGRMWILGALSDQRSGARDDLTGPLALSQSS